MQVLDSECCGALLNPSLTQRPHQKSMWEQRPYPKYLPVSENKILSDWAKIYQVLGNKYQSKLLEMIDERWVHGSGYCNIIVPDFPCVTTIFNPFFCPPFIILVFKCVYHHWVKVVDNFYNLMVLLCQWVARVFGRQMHLCRSRRLHALW